MSRPAGWTARAVRIATLVLVAGNVMAAGVVDPALPAYRPESKVAAEIGSIGDDAMKRLMDAWWLEFQKRQPEVRRAARWEHLNAATAFGGLMFEIADLAPLAREPSPSELAPYAHQFAGDMMKSPLLVQVASRDNHPAYIAVNKRPGSPLPPQVKEFLVFALSHEGQQIVANDAEFRPLEAKEAAQERAKLEGFVAPLDGRLASYEASRPVSGEINSVGSDGMKSLMDRWMRDFRRKQPGVRKGERWEHLGTLNGFHAMIVNETDIAPMGRELWPEELSAYAATHAREALLEIRVARGGFNTPQRTTAQAIFVNGGNPLARITLPQLAAIFGQPRTITRWGQLGLTGEWAERPITVYMPPQVAPNATSMQIMVLNGRAWASAAREGSIVDTAAAIARDPAGIGFGGFEEGGPGLKTLAVATTDAGPYYEGDAPNTSSGRYPLTRYMYIRLSRQPGKPLSPQVQEFLRYILSREGQEPIRYSGYFPLTADEVKEELAKLQ